MLLYSFLIAGSLRAEAPNDGVIKTPFSVRIDIFGDPGDDSGTWSANNATIGAASGHWTSGRDPTQPGFYTIEFVKGNRPSALRTLLTGAEYDYYTLLWVQDIMKWPLFKGETGQCLTSRSASNVYWRVLYSHP